MRLYTLHNASRELARWRELMRGPTTRGAARGDAGDADFPVTQWPVTEWADTMPAPALGQVKLQVQNESPDAACP